MTEHADALLIDGYPPRLPPVARLEYEHGDSYVRLEVPPEHASELTRLWLELVRDMAIVR
jgi:hypothetical protein